MAEKISVVINGEEYVSPAAQKAADGLKQVGEAAKSANAEAGQLTIGGFAVAQVLSNTITNAASKAWQAMKQFADQCTTVGFQWGAVVNDIRDKTGVTDAVASQLAGVAQIVGLSGQEMGQALSVMSNNAAKAAISINDANAAGKTSNDVFTRWGITILDDNGKLLAADQIYSNIARRHREMANGAEKTAMEMELMGRSGTKLNDLLNLSEQQVQDYTKALSNAGLVMQGDMSQAFEDTEQKGRLVDAMFQGLYTKINESLLPAIDLLYDAEIQLGNAFSDSNDKGTVLSGTIESIGNMAYGAVSGVKELITWLGHMSDAADDTHASMLSVVQDVARLAGKEVPEYIGVDKKDPVNTWKLSLNPAYNLGKLFETYGYEKKAENRTNSVADFKRQNDTTIPGAQRTNYFNTNTNTRTGTTGTSSAVANKIAANTNAMVEGMRQQIGVTKYILATDQNGNATQAGCLLAINNAMKSAGAPGVLTNSNYIPAWLEQIKKFDSSMIHAAGSGYVAKPGDVAVYSNHSSTDHVAMLGENGTTWQNGRGGGPNGGVYESGSRPESQGNLTYWVETSKFANKAGNSAYQAMADYQAKQDRFAAKLVSDAANIGKSIREAVGVDAYSKVMDDAEAKAASYREDMARAAAVGVDTKPMEQMLDKFLESSKQKALAANREQQDQIYQDRVASAGRIVDLEQGTAEEQRTAQLNELTEYRNWLQMELQETQLNYDERIKLAENLANVNKQINEQGAYDMQTAWHNALTNITNTQLNYQTAITNVFDAVNTAGVGLITSTESLGQRVSAFFDSITASILENMAKLIMQGLITHAVMSMLGMGGGGGGLDAESLYTNDFPSLDEFNNVFSIPGMASGGAITSGTYLVGENGPEVLQVNGSGGVYNNAQTRQMLTGSAGQMTINVHNETGTKMQVDQNKTNFDPKTMILNVFFEAVSTNERGINNLIKGLAANA